MPYVTVEAEVELSDFDTEDLVRELTSRGKEAEGAGQQANLIESTWDPIEGKSFSQLLDAVYEARILGKDARALELIDRLIYSASGQIV
ncbi:hypothetical protein [Salinicola rhizosphaerae]|uniref:Uncharacterized protein n=1 Tax=Salinicola rhizosphaerae TaxID=1443141 RepID=A0ABQ3EB33_9GAMM|nr:hypothetical protein [Salinicola rhizosphaerae]GHB30785.1 hypothetical protein GCM10009038_32000 [Salinicola rhizosphaerae]